MRVSLNKRLRRNIQTTAITCYCRSKHDIIIIIISMTKSARRVSAQLSTWSVCPSVGSQGVIHSCAACLGQVDPEEHITFQAKSLPLSNKLKGRFGFKLVDVDFSLENPLSSNALSILICLHVKLCSPVHYHFSRLTLILQDESPALCQVLFLIMLSV